MQTFDMKWILLADDEKHLREFLRIAIQKKADALGVNVHIVEALDGMDALEKAKTREFNCIITDLKMPGLTGEEAIRAIQNQPLNSNTPIIVVSAHVNDEFQQFCSTFEHIRYLAKPCKAEEVATATLREMKYGRKDERLSLHLVNPFIRALRSSLEEAQGKIVDIMQPEIKQPDSQLESTIHAILSVGSDISKSYFYIGFDRSFFGYSSQDDISRAATGTNILRMSNEAKEIIHDLIRRSSQELKVCLGGNPHLMSLSIFSNADRDTEGVEEIRRALGVFVKIQTSRGPLIFSALVKKDFSTIRQTISA